MDFYYFKGLMQKRYKYYKYLTFSQVIDSNTYDFERKVMVNFIINISTL